MYIHTVYMNDGAESDLVLSRERFNLSEQYHTELHSKKSTSNQLYIIVVKNTRR